MQFAPPQDVELAEVVIRISLLIKKVLREGDAPPVGGAPGEIPGTPMYVAPPHHAVVLDEGRADFEAPFVSQPVGAGANPSQAPPAAASAPAGGAFPDAADSAGEGEGARLAGDGDEGSDVAAMDVVEDDDDDEVPEPALPARQPPPSPTPAHVLTFEDLKPDGEFFAEGFGSDGAQALKPPVGEAPISDRLLMQKLFQSGKSTLTVKSICDLKFKVPGAAPKAPKKACPQASVIRLLKTFAGAFPRLAVYDHGARELRLRDLTGSAPLPPTPKRRPILSRGRQGQEPVAGPREGRP